MRFPPFSLVRPHGTNLLTAKANTWLVFAAVLVLIMATVEAAAWANLGYFVGDGVTRWIVAAAVFVIVFLLVIVVDLSLMNLDRADPEHAMIFHGEAEKGWQWHRHVAIVVRIALVIMSLLISAPLLSMLMFRNDINHQIVAEANAAIDTKRSDILAALNTSLNAMDHEIGTKREQYELEVAGRGQSGHYGNGPAALAILHDVEALEQARAKTSLQAENSRVQFEGLVEHWDVNREALAAKYNLLLPTVSVLENWHALSEITRLPAFRQTELAIQALLLFIFSGVLLLKLYQPRSVLYYQSETLQQKYLLYLRGDYNKELPFSDWCSERSFNSSPESFFHLLLAEATKEVGKTIAALEAEIQTVQSEVSVAQEDSRRLEEASNAASVKLQSERYGQPELATAAKRADDAHQISLKCLGAKRAELDELQKLLLGVKSRMRASLQAGALARLKSSKVSP